ncbi:MAG: family 43 glycosylhydrolase [Paludibacteraceae bacterium]|nr:family 43 glycosylhydrolase [Paludibacteraceae bacterium]
MNMNKLTLNTKLAALHLSLFLTGSLYAAGTFNDIPLSIPGCIEVENFNEGGQNVGYYDEDDENQGGAYRPNEGVDLDTCANNGYVLGWTKKGEWLDYTIQVDTTDQYVFSAYVASGLDGSAFSLSIDGKDVTGTISVPNTGSWSVYKIITGTTKEITTGSHTLRLEILSDYCNIDKIVFRPKSQKVVYKFTSPTADSKVVAAAPFTVGWTTNDENNNLYNLSWVSSNGENTLLKEHVSCKGSFESVIPEEYEGQTGHYVLSQVKTGCGLIATDFDGQKHTVSNPIIWADIPDVSVTRVEDTYYMASTTMHMNPGVPIMASKDLVRWHTINYAHQALGNNDNLNMTNGKNAYGKGSWASSIKYKDGTWYVLTPSYSTNKTHIFKTKDITSGQWETATLPFYHDPSLLLDDDGKVYVIYGSGNINIVELSADAMSSKNNSRTLINKPAQIAGSNFYVECEGSQVMKRNGYYYVFLISWPAGSCRSVLCYRSKSLTGSFEGKVLLQDNGVAQGGIFDTPEGDWYGMFFQDHGSVGRIPYLLPVSWSNDWPVLGNNGKVPSTLSMAAAQEDGYGIVTSDDFDEETLPLEWQWNHNPDNRYWSLSNGVLRLTNGRTDSDVEATQNTLTQRTFGPNCSGWTQLNTKGMKDGDCAGLVALQDIYGWVGVKVSGNSKSIVMMNDGKEIASQPLSQDEVWLRIDMNYQNQADKANFYYSLDGSSWQTIGNTLGMKYELTHFTGYRYGLFNYGTKSTGGYADFNCFKIGKNVNSPIYMERSCEENIIAESVEVTILPKGTATNTEISQEENLLVSPNPAIHHLQVSGVDNISRMELIDQTGRVALTSATTEMELPNELNGIFILRIYTTNNCFSKKIIVK